MNKSENWKDEFISLYISNDSEDFSKALALK